MSVSGVDKVDSSHCSLPAAGEAAADQAEALQLPEAGEGGACLVGRGGELGERALAILDGGEEGGEAGLEVRCRRRLGRRERGAGGGGEQLEDVAGVADQRRARLDQLGVCRSRGGS
jgi:hypothetical protein